LKEKFLTLIWFSLRPTFYWHGLELFFRKFRKNYDSSFYYDQAKAWAEQQSVPVNRALEAIGLSKKGDEIPSLDKAVIVEANSLAGTSKVKMYISCSTHLNFRRYVLKFTEF